MWLRTIGKKEGEQKSSPGTYVLSFLGALVNVLLLGCSLTSWLLFASYQLVLYAVEGAVFAIWRR